MTLVIGFWLIVVIVPIALTAVRKAKNKQPSRPWAWKVTLFFGVLIPIVLEGTRSGYILYFTIFFASNRKGEDEFINTITFGRMRRPRN
ncbi:uncharacterized protein LOC62_06G007837 [Vanrija pseudolonga]|uniref:Uncharacterized protein n=1 Tax=Vanrija pseudolonga TaxID=143232 RepID=A0AAF0YCP9_9TREE|nr:hypothetical protein LOC62_06G007837 [Vanrija pseudolonga]